MHRHTSHTTHNPRPARLWIVALAALAAVAAGLAISESRAALATCSAARPSIDNTQEMAHEIVEIVEEIRSILKRAESAPFAEIRRAIHWR
jgi:hypothetical protein